MSVYLGIINMSKTAYKYYYFMFMLLQRIGNIQIVHVRIETLRLCHLGISKYAFRIPYVSDVSVF